MGTGVTELTQNQIQTHEGEITPKVRKPELSFLYAKRHLVLFYISNKYYQNIPKGIRVSGQTRNQIQTQKGEITPKVRKPELTFLYVTNCLVLFYISAKYHKHIPMGIRLTERARSQCIITLRYNKGR